MSDGPFFLHSPGSILVDIVQRKETGGELDFAGKTKFSIRVADIGRFATTPLGSNITLSRTVDRGQEGEHEETMTFRQNEDASATVEFRKGLDPPIVTAMIPAPRYFVLKSLMFSSLPGLSAWDVGSSPSLFSPEKYSMRGPANASAAAGGADAAATEAGSGEGQ